ncbi:hypothetical protein NQT65_19260 [Pseudoalteromonas agarivorans]|uniref:hypothetical protein n=1 Tax=Pseudoalteromonas agarivorans TaxID=176102 RepID=UPI0021196935|nr:hypothetical protein [Pseudoalteromonas agarivorans]MCQ8822334.1 hypothetical protein [Pseudoalteromonas agarivorans]
MISTLENEWLNNEFLQDLSNGELAYLAMETTAIPRKIARSRKKYAFFNKGRKYWFDDLDPSLGVVSDNSKYKWVCELELSESKRIEVNELSLSILRKRSEERPYITNVLIRYALLTDIFDHLVLGDRDLRHLVSNYFNYPKKDAALLYKYADLCLLFVKHYSISSGYSFLRIHKTKLRESGSYACWEVYEELLKELTVSVLEKRKIRKSESRESDYKPNHFVYFVMNKFIGRDGDYWFDMPLDSLLVCNK